MSVTLVLEGLQDLFVELRNLPEHLANEAAGIIEASVHRAAAEIRTGYADHPTLVKGVKTKVTRSGVSIYGQVQSTARTKEGISLALLYEIGTQARHVALGANRGSMPAANVAVPVIQREQQHMYERLRQLIRENGLEVSG